MMRGDFMDDARRFEDVDKAVMKQIERQSSPPLFDPLETFRHWLELQSSEKIAEIISTIGDYLTESDLTRIVGYNLRLDAIHLQKLIAYKAKREP